MENIGLIILNGLSITRCREFGTLEQLGKYTKCLSAILDQQAKSVNHFQTVGRQPCITDIHISDVLLLLYNWTKLCGKGHLQEDIQEVLCQVTSDRTESASKEQNVIVGLENCTSEDKPHKDCAEHLVKICCQVSLTKNMSTNQVDESANVIIKILNIFLTFFHLYSPRNMDIQQRAAKWILESLRNHAPYSVEYLLLSGNEVGKAIVCKILALYDAEPSESIRNSTDDDNANQHVNEILLFMLDRCLEDTSTNLLTETLAKPAFKKIISKLKSNSVANVHVLDISTIMTEMFSLVDVPVHSNVLLK